MRVRVEERRRDDAYFAHVDQQLRQYPSILDVVVTPLTGSILILHEGTDPDVIIGYAKAFDLFEIAPPASGPIDGEPLPAHVIRAGLARVDQWVRRESEDRADLRSLALLGLLGAAIWQMMRGTVLPAGATLLWYALVLSRDRTATATQPKSEWPPASGPGQANEYGAHQG
jgi:hypothetical protein